MRTPDDLLAEISDELNRRVSSSVMSLISASPTLKVLPGFPFTLMRVEETPAEDTVEYVEKPLPVMYEVGRSDVAGDFVKFYLGNPTTTNGDYPVRMPLNTRGRQFFFLRVVADVQSACVCLDPGPPASWVCVDNDVTTSSVTVMSWSNIPEQVNDIESPPCGDPEDGTGWGNFFGSPSGKYIVYMPLLCLDFTGGVPVSYASDRLSEIESKNPMYTRIRDDALQGGDSTRLWWSAGAPTGAVDAISGGDPGALSVGGLYAVELDPDDSPFILQSL